MVARGRSFLWTLMGEQSEGDLLSPEASSWDLALELSLSSHDWLGGLRPGQREQVA